VTSAKIKIGTKRISPAQLRALAEEGKYMNTPVRTYFRKITSDEEARIVRTVRAGLAQGLTPTQLAAQISGGVVNGIEYKPIVELSRSQSTALANTMTRSSANKAAARLYMQNQSLIRGVQQVSTLDSKTSDICRAYDGAQWEYDIEATGGYSGINTNLPFNDGPPRHFNCRSYIVPILKTLEELKIPQSAQGKIKAAQNALERTRASSDSAAWGNSTWRDAVEARGVKGDKLLNIDDTVEELRSVNAIINNDGTVRLFHRTNEAAARIRKTGVMTSKEPSVFFSTSRNSEYGKGFGDHVIAIDARLEDIQLDDIFRGKDASVSIAKGENGRLYVKLVDKSQETFPLPSRASVPQSMNFETWLRGKPDAYQRELLGEVKYTAWKEKSFSLRDFLDRAGRPKSIAEIRAEMNMGGNVVVDTSTTAATATATATAHGNTFYNPMTGMTHDLTGMPDVPLPRAPLTGKDEWGWPEIPKPIGIKESTTELKFPEYINDRTRLDIDAAWQTKMKKLNGMALTSDENAAMRDARFHMMDVTRPGSVTGTYPSYTDWRGTLHMNETQLPKVGVSEKFVSTIDPVQFEFDNYRGFRGVYRPNKLTIGINDQHYASTGREYISNTITHEYGHHWHISWVDQGFRHPTQYLKDASHTNKAITTLGSLRKNETLMGAYEKAIYEFQKAQRNYIESIPGRSAKLQIKKQFAYNYADANRYLNVRVWKPDERITYINLPHRVKDPMSRRYVAGFLAGSRNDAAKLARDAYRKKKLPKKEWYGGDKWDALEAEADAQVRVGVSQYAHQNVWEWFAESWQTYHHGSPAERLMMKRYSPDTYKFIEDFLLTVQ
jgi:Phage Mu protein F like protein